MLFAASPVVPTGNDETEAAVSQRLVPVAPGNGVQPRQVGAQEGRAAVVGGDADDVEPLGGGVVNINGLAVPVEDVEAAQVSAVMLRCGGSAIKCGHVEVRGQRK